MKGYILFLPQLIGVVTVNLENHNWRCNYLKVLKFFLNYSFLILRRKAWNGECRYAGGWVVGILQVHLVFCLTVKAFLRLNFWNGITFEEPAWLQYSAWDLNCASKAFRGNNTNYNLWLETLNAFENCEKD